MKTMFEALESRTMLSVTTATLATDLSGVTTQSASVSAEIKTLQSQDKTALAALTADVKKLPASKTLLAAVKADITKLSSATSTDGKALVNSSSALAKKAEGTGVSQLTSFTTKNVTTLTTDSTTLPGLVVTPLGKLNLDLTGPLVTDLGALGSANPSATQLAADIAALDTAYSATAAALTSAATVYQSNVGTLAGDLATVATLPPNIVFTYKGKAVNTQTGKSEPVTFTVSSELADGTWTGAVSLVNKAGVTLTYPGTGTVAASGAFTGTLATTSGSELLTGTVSGKTIKGSGQGGALGTFTITHS